MVIGGRCFRVNLRARKGGTGVPSLQKQFAKGRGEVDELRGILCQSAKAFPVDKMVPGMLDYKIIEDTAKKANETIKDKARVNLIISNRAGGNAPLIAQKIADRLYSEKQQGDCFECHFGFPNKMS
jgi:hypothetical protein